MKHLVSLEHRKYGWVSSCTCGWVDSTVGRSASASAIGASDHLIDRATPDRVSAGPAEPEPVHQSNRFLRGRALAAEAQLARIAKYADGYDQRTDRLWQIRRVLGLEGTGPAEPEPVAGSGSDARRNSGSSSTGHGARKSLVQVQAARVAGPAGLEPERDECRVVEVDGDSVLVRGSGEMNEEDRKFFAEVVRAAREKAARDASPAEPEPSA